MIGVIFALGFEAKNFNKILSNSRIIYYILNVTGPRIADDLDSTITKGLVQFRKNEYG